MSRLNYVIQNKRKCIFDNYTALIQNLFKKLYIGIEKYMNMIYNRSITYLPGSISNIPKNPIINFVFLYE